jgi:hypothetical protein
LGKAWKKKPVKPAIQKENKHGRFIRFTYNDVPEELEAQERLYISKDPGYVIEALQLAKKDYWPLPYWIYDYLIRQEREKYSKAHIDFERYQKVKELRESDLTWAAAFEKAGEAFHCSDESVRKSYKRVNKNLKYFRNLPPR